MDKTTLNGRTFRLLDVQWHVGHQYEMLKFPFVAWSWLAQYKRPSINPAIRGRLNGLFETVTAYEPGRYDAAILHLDQECLHTKNWKFGKGSVYREMNALILDIPKIVIMHGTPHSPEARSPFCQPRWMCQRLRKEVGKNYLVVNSQQAAREWGWGLPIVHGLDAAEWFDLPKEPRVVTVLSAGGMDSYYDREFLLDVRQALAAKGISLCHIGADHVCGSWDEYRTLLGSSLIYFNPTRASPMPRARTEAMFSGCCVVTTPHHDAGEFIEHGVNGFLVKRDAAATAELIEDLLRNPGRAIEIGQHGKATARARFDNARFARDWQALLAGVTGEWMRQ